MDPTPLLILIGIMDFNMNDLALMWGNKHNRIGGCVKGSFANTFVKELATTKSQYIRFLRDVVVSNWWKKKEDFTLMLHLRPAPQSLPLSKLSHLVHLVVVEKRGQMRSKMTMMSYP